MWVPLCWGAETAWSKSSYSLWPHAPGLWGTVRASWYSYTTNTPQNATNHIYPVSSNGRVTSCQYCKIWWDLIHDCHIWSLSGNDVREAKRLPGKVTDTACSEKHPHRLTCASWILLFIRLIKQTEGGRVLGWKLLIGFLFVTIIGFALFGFIFSLQQLQ